MATVLSLSSPNTLMAMLNAILIGVVIYWATNRFVYIMNVAIYAIARSVIPIITTLVFAGMLGISVEVSMGSVILSMLIMCIPYFIIGLAVIKITEKIVEWFNSDTIIYFIASFAIIDSIISWLFVTFLGLFIK